MGRNHITILFILFASQVFAQCDVLGGLLELQFTTNYDALLRGDGQCLKPTTVTGGLVLTGGELKIIEGDTTGQVLTWDGGTWVPQLVIRDTFFNGLNRSGRNVKLGGTLVQNTTIDGVKTYDFVLSNMRRINFEAERTSGAAYTTMQLGSTDIEGFDLFHISTSSPANFGWLRVNNTTGNILRLQSATNVQTEVNQYWDGASHVTDIGSTDGVDGKTLRITKTGMFAFSLAKVDEFSSPGIMMYDTFTNEIRYQSPDILLASTVAEPANQVVYGTGTGIDSDTSLTYNSNRVLNMKRRANDANPAIKIDVDDISTTGFWAFQIAPRNQTNYPWANKFALLSGNYPLQTPGHEGNHVWRMGYNLDRSEPALSALEIAFESHYWQAMLDGRRTRNLEWHIEQRDTLGIVHRPITIRAAHDGSIGDVGLQSDGFYLSKYSSNENYMLYNRYNKIWYWNDTVTQVYNIPQVGYPFWRFRAADGSRLWKIAEADASNRLVLNPEANDLYTYAPNFIFHTAAGFRTADGNNISIGSSTYPTGLDIYANSTNILTMRSASANSGADTWALQQNYFGGTGYFAITNPAGNDPFSIRGNTQSGLLNLNNTSVGVNVFNPTAATLHVNGTVKLQGLPTRTTQTRVVYADGSGLLALGELSDFTGGGTVNYIPKWQTSTKLTDSQIIDNGTSVGVGNGGTFLTSGKLEVNHTYTNTTDVNLSLTGNKPFLGWRTSSARFAFGSNYHSSDILSLLGGGSENPTTTIARFKNDGDVFLDGGKLQMENGKILSAALGSSFGSISPPSDADFYAAISFDKRFRVHSISGKGGIDIWSSTSSANRNFSLVTSYFSGGQLSLLQSSTAGGTPGTNLVTWLQNGNMGVQTTNAAQTFHIEGTARITGSDGTATTITGRDADGDISNVSLSGMAISSGTLSLSNSGVTAGTYGEEGAPFEIDVAADGRITSAAAIAYTSATYTSGTTTWQALDKVVFADPTSGNVIIEMNGAMHEFVPYILAGGSNLTNTIKIRVTGGGEVFKISGDYGTTTSDYTLTAGQHLTITRVGTTYIVNKN